MSKKPKEYKPRYKVTEPRPFPIAQKPEETLDQYYKRLAKSVDRRMGRLKEASTKPFMEHSTEYAYEWAMNELHRINGSAAKHFETKPPKHKQKMEAMLNIMKTFLTSPTSTPGGIVSTYKKRANTVNQKYGTNFSWEELNHFFEEEKNVAWLNKYGSKTVMKSIGQIQKYADEYAKEHFEGDVRKVTRKHLMEKAQEGSGDEVLDEMINKQLKNSHLHIKDLYKRKK